MARRISLLTLVLAGLLAAPACGDSDLKKVAKALQITAESIAILQTTVIDANVHGLVSDDDAAQILELCVKANQAGKEATAVIRAVSQLSSPTRAQLAGILAPVIRSVGRLLDDLTLGIKNDERRGKVRLALITAQSALNTVEIVLASGG